jgi:hypothetical protein
MRCFFTILVALVLLKTAKADLIITGVVDGNEPGGLPKGLELYATTDIPDLSVFSIQRYTNGGATPSSETRLPNVSLNMGSFFYTTGTASSDIFFTNNGFTVGLSGQTVANINGDDLLQVITTAGSVAIDTFGLPGQGDTNFYENSIAYRLNTSFLGDPNGSLNASANFTISPWVSSADFGTRFGSFNPVPEPSSLLVLGICGILVGPRYRRQRYLTC